MKLIRKILYKSAILYEDIIHDAVWEIKSKGLKSMGSHVSMDYPFTLRGNEYIEIGDNVHCCRGCRIQAWDYYEGIQYKPQIIIGNNVSINMDVDIAAINLVVLGNGVQIASNVLITDHFHGKIDSTEIDVPPARRKLYSSGAVIIEDNVWIGFNVAILPNVTIGKNSIIGAGAVVTRDIPANSVAGGVPARIIRKL